ATPSGILAAIAVEREGRSAVIVEPGRWLGGMLGAGLKPTQDCPNYEAVGGMTRELLLTLGAPAGKSFDEVREFTRTAMSPADVRTDFGVLVRDHKVRVIHDHRISRVTKQDGRITEAFFDLAPFDDYGLPPEDAQATGNLSVSAKVFIDASYEGELMARAGVSYRTGRESSEEFNEERAGVRPPVHLTPIDPFVEPGNPASGLLPLVEPDHGKPVGAADHYTQAYNYRYYVTSDPAHRFGFEPPFGYDPRDFELVGRYVAHLTKTIKDRESLFRELSKIFPGWRNSGEYNYHRDLLFTMAPLGISQLYAGGDYATKARVWKRHHDYLRGLHHFMSTDPRVPEQFRSQTAQLGLDGRHHPDTHGWPHQLYVRVSRRLQGRYTITAHDVYNRTRVDDPISLAQYGIDTYPSRRIWLQRDGRVYVANEGNMFIGKSKGPTNTPYPISYRAITPRKEECTNLLVPVCFSATHLGYASARMEPVFMICGESAGVAAVQALAERTAVQDIDAKRLQSRLLELGQRLVWPAGGE
ncbi:MAG: FAD-dependent oxidoreductase, partial [bacterium]|nr:FAD-dependent oxidoreductase [bacterium]